MQYKSGCTGQFLTISRSIHNNKQNYLLCNIHYVKRKEPLNAIKHSASESKHLGTNLIKIG